MQTSRRANESTLVADAQAGDRRALELLCEAYLPLVRARARERAGREPVSYADLVQDGSVALVEAVRAYDPEHGAPFAAFAATRVRYAIADACARARTLGGLPVRVPRSAWRQLAAVARDDGDVDAAARRTGLTQREVRQSRELLARRAVSVDEAAGTVGYGGVIDEVARRELVARVRAELAQLTDTERRLVCGPARSRSARRARERFAARPAVRALAGG